MLNGTTAEIKPREALRINPAKTCQPIGAMYAALGIHGCMPHSHGSQGCCSYPPRMTHAALSPEERARRGIHDNLVRFSVGLENASDLEADLINALKE